MHFAKRGSPHPGVTLRRNPYNIGGNANILRSVEWSGAQYHWVIGDDEWTFTPEGLQELQTVFEAGEADIIFFDGSSQKLPHKAALLLSKIYSAALLEMGTFGNCVYTDNTPLEQSKASC